MSFKLISPYKPAGDQPKAISSLVENIQHGLFSQVLLGVTGSGKTFTMANTIQEVNKPTLVISHNKTLAAQLYGALRDFFPYNLVEYFVSYYDYYQPEVYLPVSDIYISKELAINDELERLRLSTVSSLLSGRSDVIVVASVSCIYGVGNPETFRENSHLFKVGCHLPRNNLLRRLVDMLYVRNDSEFKRGHFRVRGDTVDLFVAYGDYAYRFVFWGDELEAIILIDPSSGKTIKEVEEALVFPANLFVTSKEMLQKVIKEIQLDLNKQVGYLASLDKLDEAKRLSERTEMDIEMLRELGYCSGIENYSRYIDGRAAGVRPFCLLDYFPKDYLMIMDESHVTIPQFKAMWSGDRARKMNLVDHGFRLPSAMDNRPLNFSEFEHLIYQIIFVSATPADYELRLSDGIVVEQIIRPTGLLDPSITVRPTSYQMQDICKEIDQVVQVGERVLITTLTKRMAEELTDYLVDAHIRCRYIHSEVKTLDRVAILDAFRDGLFDVLVGVNLLREGLDLPQASLMIILDADKEGFLRDARSLIQTIGRVARHMKGQVIMYADRITDSMKQAIDETERRRSLQMDYNLTYCITPRSVGQHKAAIGLHHPWVESANYHLMGQEDKVAVAAESAPLYGKGTIQEEIACLESQMHQAAAQWRFLEADQLKQRIAQLKKS